jgi:glyoxylase-like metal-dependent hydrolase (beta-lactamase superfamily II)
MDAALSANGTPPDSITDVVLTHLHTDHSNGLFIGNPDTPALRFPRATHHVQQSEWDDAMTPNERTDAVYIRHRLQRVADGGSLHLFEGDIEIVPGIKVQRTGGHTRGHQTVEVRSGNERFVYLADLVPTRFHLKGPWVAAVDLFPLETMKAKRALLADCCDTKTIIGFDHDAGLIFGRLVQKQKWMDVVPVDVTAKPI